MTSHTTGRALVPRVITALLMFLLSVIAARADLRIVSSPGGEVGSYLQLFESIRQSGDRVIIDGPCLSACTMVLGVIPRDRICVTRRARLGFHAAWHPGQNGRPVTSRGGTQLLMDVYPPEVKSWLERRGGLSPRMLYLYGRELASMYPACR